MAVRPATSPTTLLAVAWFGIRGNTFANARAALAAVDAGKTSVTPSLKFKVMSSLAPHGPRRAVNAVVAKINRGRDR